MQAVLLIGAPGSGKSTFYTERFFSTHVRINLDMVKTRRREQLLVAACLEGKTRFVVDNTNVSREERLRYLPAVKDEGFVAVAYFFECTLAECLERNAGRRDKARVPDKGVRGRYQRLERPSRKEGFEELYIVRVTPKGFVVERDDDGR